MEQDEDDDGYVKVQFRKRSQSFRGIGNYLRTTLFKLSPHKLRRGYISELIYLRIVACVGGRVVVQIYQKHA